MQLKNINFVISKKVNLNKKEKDFLIETYRKLFEKIYGPDLVDAYIKVTKSSLTEINYKNSEILKHAQNYIKAEELFNTSQTDKSIEMLFIYSSDSNLIGASRLKKINDNEAFVLDIVIGGIKIEQEREIWKKAVIFLEKYFINCGYEKMYINIPIKDAPLLYRAIDLGFKEDPKNIDIDDLSYTYLLDKKLERNENCEFNISCK